MMKKALVVGLTVAALAVAAYVISKKLSDDEAPIIVKNGSMTVDTVDGRWEEDGGSWRNETGKQHGNELWVKVVLTNSTTCRGSGHPVVIDYSAAGFQAIFNVTGGKTPRTIVAPRAQLNLETSQRLRHGAAGDGGYITGVRIGGNPLQCGITQSNLDAIHICSASGVSDCQ
jgi:hypothetical protein